MKRFVRVARWFLVTIGIVVLTSFSVDATVGHNGFSQSAIAILATSLNGKKSDCGEGMVRLGGDFSNICIDAYEAVPGDACPQSVVQNANGTRANMDIAGCKPVSVANKNPWTFVNLNQAQELCGRAGKRLLTNAEWYRASVGSPDIENSDACNVHSNSVALGGQKAQCISGAFVHDMIGNVWEWVDGSIENGKYNARTVPASGYVTEADVDGVVTKTAEGASVDYHSDYFWSSEDGVYGMLRGGFYGSGNDAGIYSIQGKTAPSFAGNAIGFRCARNI